MAQAVGEPEAVDEHEAPAVKAQAQASEAQAPVSETQAAATEPAN